MRALANINIDCLASTIARSLASPLSQGVSFPSTNVNYIASAIAGFLASPTQRVHEFDNIALMASAIAQHIASPAQYLLSDFASAIAQRVVPLARTGPYIETAGIDVEALASRVATKLKAGKPAGDVPEATELLASAIAQRLLLPSLSLPASAFQQLVSRVATTINRRAAPDTPEDSLPSDTVDVAEILKREAESTKKSHE